MEHTKSTEFALVRGGGDLGTGVAHALHRAGWRVFVLDRQRPTALRLGVAFAAAALSADRHWTVEGVEAAFCLTQAEVRHAWATGRVAVGNQSFGLLPAVLIDVRMRGLSEPNLSLNDAPLVIAVGPGYEAGHHAHVLIESNRGPRLGQLVRQGSCEAHTGIPGEVSGERQRRLLRAPCAGVLNRRLALGTLVDEGDVVAEVGGQAVRAKLGGVLRGLKLSGLQVFAGQKIGDVDPRWDPELIYRMTDKAERIGAAALEAIAELGPHP